jgi:hypothetical protein
VNKVPSSVTLLSKKNLKTLLLQRTVHGSAALWVSRVPSTKGGWEDFGAKKWTPPHFWATVEVSSWYEAAPIEV